jgi:hypothetical protein
MSVRRLIVVCSVVGLLLSGEKCHAQYLIGNSSMGTYVHPLQSPAEPLDLAKNLTEAQRDQVHFVIVNGFDYLFVGNLNGLAEYVQSLGFRNVRLYYLYQMSSAEADIRATHQQHPDARIILLGYSWGANAVRSIANRLGSEGITLESLIYLGGDTIQNEPRSTPANCRHCLNICGNGLLFLGYNMYYKGFDLDGADNRRLAVRHMLLPSRRDTLAWVSEEVIRVARDGGKPAAPATPATPNAPLTPPPVDSTPRPSPRIPTPTAPPPPYTPVTMPKTTSAPRPAPLASPPGESQPIVPASASRPAAGSWQVQAAPVTHYDDE